MNTTKSPVARFRVGLLGLTSALAGFALQGCFAPQPVPECTVTTSAAGQGLPPFFVLLTRVDSTGGGSCGDLKTMQVGMQRFRTQASGGSFTIAIRSSPVVDEYLGYNFEANTDESNDCYNEADCQGVKKVENSCIVKVDDGGVELFDGTPVTVDDTGVATVDPMDGGAVFEVQLVNECGPVDDPIPRSDPADPEGKNLNMMGKLPQYPTDGVCTVTELTSTTENFEATTYTTIDGTTDTLPATTYGLVWTNVNILNTNKVPGTAFTGDVKFTVDGCTANYKAVGFWSGSNDGRAAIPCTPSTSEELSYAPECDTQADVDAGRGYGSGISPDFKPLCDRKMKICVPSVDVTTLK